MVDNTKGSFLMIKERALGFIYGEMAENMKVSGRMINSMGREFILIRSRRGLKVIG